MDLGDNLNIPKSTAHLIKKQNKLLEKREKLEQQQSTELAWGEGTARQRDEWDMAYDSGKQKKVRLKGDGAIPYDKQNQLF